jgi:hypothetical protein
MVGTLFLLESDALFFSIRGSSIMWVPPDMVLHKPVGVDASGL